MRADARPQNFPSWMRWVEKSLRRLDNRINNKTGGAGSGGSVPSGPAGGDLTGAYPNPTIAAGVVTSVKIADGTITDDDVDPANKDGLATEPSLRTLGTGPQQAAKGDHTHAATGGPPTGPAGGELSGTYPNPTIADNVIDSANVVNGSLVGADLANDTITSTQIGPGAVGQNELADNAVNSAKIQDGTVTLADLAPGTIPTSLPPNGPAGGDLTGTYPNPQLGPGSVGSAEIADGSITAGDLAPGTLPPPLGVQDENATVVASATLLDFQGGGVQVTPGAAGEAIITIAGPPTGVGRAGEIALWGTNAPPANWLLCDGRAVSRSTYADLFNAIGTTYGAGDGSTTFNLPNLQSKFPLGADTGHPLGSVGGTATHTHGVNAHTHQIPSHAHNTGQAAGPTLDTVPTTGGQVLPRTAHTHTTDATGIWNTYHDANFGGATGTGWPDNGLPPYLALNYIIRYQTTAIVPGSIVVQDEHTTIAPASILDFVGPQVTATDAGSGKITVTISGDGTPIGPAGGDLTGTYPNPQLGPDSVGAAEIAPGSVGSSEIADGSIQAGDIAPGVIPTVPPNLPPSGPAGGDLSGTYPAPQIAAGVIVDADVSAANKDGAVATPSLRTLGTGAQQAAPGNHSHAALADGDKGDITITGGVWTIDNGAVNSAKIADGTIVAADLAPGTIPTTLPGPPTGPAGGGLTGTYPNPTLATDSVGAGQIITGAVGSDEILDGAVGNAELANGSVTNAKLGADAVTTDKILNGTILAADLAAGVIPAALPPNGPAGGSLAGTYPNPTLAANSVGASQITDGSVGSAEIADGSIAAGDLAPGVIPTTLPPSGPAGGGLAGTYPNPTLAANSVGASQIIDGSVGSAEIADGSITAGDLSTALDGNLVHRTGDESIAGVKTITDPLLFEEEGASPAAPATGSRFFTRGGKMWVRTPTTEYALAVESVAVSLLPNGSFEALKAGGVKPEGWNDFWHGGAAAVYTDTAQFTDGVRSVRAHLNATVDDNVVLQTDDAFPVTPGGVLRLEFNARSGAQAGAKVEPTIQTSVDATGGAPNFFVAGTTVTGAPMVFPVNGWTHYVMQFPIPAGHTLARLCLRTMKNAAVVDANTTQQDVWIDSAVAQMDTSASAGETLEWRSAGMRDAYSLPGGAPVTIPFRTDYGGTGITINAAGQLVIGTPGTYHAVVSMEMVGTSYSDTYLRQWRAGTMIQSRNTVGSGSAGSGWDSLSLNGTFLCQAGDIFEVAASSGGPSAVTIEVNRSQFTIHKLAGPGPIGPVGEKGEKGDVGYADLSARLVYWSTSTADPNGNAPLVVDSYNVWPGDRILKVTTPVASARDGIYVVQSAGTGSNGVWLRATDVDTITEAYAANVKIGEGAIWGGTRWSNSLRSTDTYAVTIRPWFCFAGDTGWIDVPFAAGISQYPSNDKCQYRRLNGVVYTKGLAILTGSAGTALIFIYPPGFRPNADQGPTHVPTAMQGVFGIVNTWKDGRVTHNTGPIGWCSLNYAPFPADN